MTEPIAERTAQAMTRPPRRLWFEQIRSVIGLEIKKTFFARRGLWVYGLALLPVLLLIGHTMANSHQRERSAWLAGQTEKPLTCQDLQAVKLSMTSQEVVALIGKPPTRFRWNR